MRQGVALILMVCLSLTGCEKLAYQQMNDPSRDAWQKPKEVVDRLAVKPGDSVADIGAGGGYFTWYLADAVGPHGTVYAVDIDRTGLDIIRRDMPVRGVKNVVPIQAQPMDPALPERVDLVFSCDTYHHMNDRIAYFQSLASRLKPDARVAILDFHPHGFFSGFLGHGTSVEDVRREMEAAGYERIAAFDLIDRQHFQIFAPSGSRRSTAP